MFWVLDKDCVVYLEEELADVEFPNLEHSAVQNIADRALRIKGNAFSNSSIIITPAEEPAAAARKADHVTFFQDDSSDMVVPESMGGESTEVVVLELLDDICIELGMFCHSERLSVIVSSMPEDFRHMTI